MHPVSMVLYKLRGSDNAFGKVTVMIQNLGVALQRLKKYNTLSKQKERLQLRILWFKGGQAIGERTGVHIHRC